MYSQKVPYAQAILMTSQARPVIKPNYGFEQQLAKYEAKLFGKTENK
jgi:hypothetical protein